MEEAKMWQENGFVSDTAVSMYTGLLLAGRPTEGGAFSFFHPAR